MKPLSALLFSLVVVLLGACTTNAKWDKTQYELHQDDPRFLWGIPMADH
jgi:aconitase B